MNKINEVFNFSGVQLMEAEDGIVDGKNILARVSGTGFIVEGSSQNRRYYSRQLWEKAINDNAKRIKDRQMFGWLGHSASNGDENLSNIALIVTGLSINEGQGTIEYVVPATEAGKSLNALLRAGVQLSVSSRASGSVSHKDQNGNEVLDPKTYRLAGFDIVQNPGVKDATPNLVESKTKKEDQKMEITLEKYTEALEEKAALATKLEAALQHKPEHKDVAAYEALGTVAELTEAADKLAQYEAAATLTQVEQLLALVEDYQSVADVDEASAAVDVAAKVESLGGMEKIEAVFAVAEQYVELGSLADVEEALSADKEDDKAESVKSFMAKHDVEEAVAIRVLGHCDYDEEAASAVVGLFRDEKDESKEDAKDESKESAKDEKAAAKDESTHNTYKSILGY